MERAFSLVISGALSVIHITGHRRSPVYRVGKVGRFPCYLILLNFHSAGIGMSRFRGDDLSLKVTSL